MGGHQSKQSININPKKFILDTNRDVDNKNNIVKSSTIFNKYFYVPEENNGFVSLHKINLKGLNNSIYLYLDIILPSDATHDTKKNKKKLIHIFNVDDNIRHLDKYIQLSTDFKTIAIPENNNIFVFGISDIIKNNVPVMCSTNTIHIRNTETIHKCLLYENNYVMIHVDNDKYVITLYDLIKKSSPTVINLNVPINKLIIKFSPTCKYFLTLDTTNGQMDLINLQNVRTEYSFIVKNHNDIVGSTATLSDDGKLITFFTVNNVSPGQSVSFTIDEIVGVTSCFSPQAITCIQAPLGNDVFAKEIFAHYPNPVTDFLYLKHSMPLEQVVVLNAVGQQISSYVVAANETRIDMSGLERGVYFVKVTVAHTSKTIPIVKQ